MSPLSNPKLKDYTFSGVWDYLFNILTPTFHI